ncbi:MAG: MATE family efflux transporter [Pseudomonadota bacterium]
MATQFSQMAMGVADTIMCGRSSTEDLAAVAIGAGIWLPLFLFMAGVLMAITPTVAQLVGEKNYPQIGHVIRQSLWLALLLGLFAFFILQSISPLLEFMDVQVDIRPIIIEYLKAISWGMPGIALFLILRYLCEGMANTFVVMIVGLLGLLLNIFINYLLIFGHGGFSAMGGVGAGWATSITHWLMVLMLFSYIFVSAFFKKIKLFSNHLKVDIYELVQLLKLGVPMGIAFFVEGSIFSIIALFIASLGTIIVAAQQVALNFSSLLFMFPLSFSMGITILVGQARGRKDYTKMLDVIKTGYFINICIAIILAVFIVVNNSLIASLYTDNGEVIQLASQLLLFAALYQISDAIQLCSGGALRGLKDTAIPMLFSVISFWIVGFPIGYILSLSDYLVPPMGAQGFWIGLILALTLSAILLSSRLIYQLKKFDKDQLELNTVTSSY